MQRRQVDVVLWVDRLDVFRVESLDRQVTFNSPAYQLPRSRCLALANTGNASMPHVHSNCLPLGDIARIPHGLMQ